MWTAFSIMAVHWPAFFFGTNAFILLDMFFSRNESLLDFAVEGNTTRSMGRKQGKQAAMMIRPFSAPAHQRSTPTS